MFNYASLERRLAALEANRGASLRFGTVTEVSEADGTARVQLPDGQNMVSHPLRVMQARSLKDKKQCFPDVGEPVACLFAGQGFEQGVVLGAIYSPKCAAPNQQSGQDYTKYEDGTELWYDRTAHKLVAKVKGDVDIEAEGHASLRAEKNVLTEAARTITLKAPRINIAGKLSITDRDGRPGSGDLFGNYRILNGSLEVPNGDVIAGITRLRDHLHTGIEPGPGSSGPPTNSEQMGNSGLSEDDERERVFERLTDAKDKLILCLPEIATAEYGRAIPIDRAGWDYFHGFILKWLHGSPYSIKDKYDNGGQAPAFVDWKWLMKFRRFADVASELKEYDYLFSDAAKANITLFLTKDGAFEGGGRDFDYISLPWDKQRARAFQNKSMTISGMTSLFPPMPDGLQVAVANVTILALAAGHTKVDTQGKKSVIVTQVAFFIHDGFDFSGDQPLGGWTCTDTNKQFDFLNGTPLENADFRNFRENSKYGCDFRIMTKPELVWEGVYRYAVNSL